MQFFVLPGYPGYPGLVLALNKTVRTFKLSNRQLMDVYLIQVFLLVLDNKHDIWKPIIVKVAVGSLNPVKIDLPNKALKAYSDLWR